jgi:hypothetical protein
VNNQTSFVICIANDDYKASLELRKVYQVVPDKAAETAGYVRVVDESGEDYLYPQELFKAVKFPARIREAVLAAK